MYKNSTYKARFSSLENLVLIKVHKLIFKFLRLGQSRTYIVFRVSLCSKSYLITQVSVPSLSFSLRRMTFWCRERPLGLGTIQMVPSTMFCLYMRYVSFVIIQYTVIHFMYNTLNASLKNALFSSSVL